MNIPMKIIARIMSVVSTGGGKQIKMSNSKSFTSSVSSDILDIGINEIGGIDSMRLRQRKREIHISTNTWAKDMALASPYFELFHLVMVTKII